MYQSIIVSAYWFSEGGFWSVSVDGYITNDGPDDPVNIDCDPNSLDNEQSDEAGVIEELEAIAELHKDDAGYVVIHVNGNEVKTVGTP